MHNQSKSQNFSRPSNEDQENICVNLPPQAQSLYRLTSLYCSAISSPIEKGNKMKQMSSRIYKFCQQERLLAEKDLRIQELLQERASVSLKQELFQSSNWSNKVNQFQVEIQNLKYQNRSQRFLLNEKDLIIQGLRKQLSSSLLLPTKPRQSFVEVKQQLQASNPCLQQKRIQSQTKVLGLNNSQVVRLCECVDKLAQENNLQFKFKIQNHQQPELIQLLIEFLKQIREKIYKYKEQVETQSKSIIHFEKVIQQKINQRGQLVKQNTSLKQQILSRQAVLENQLIKLSSQLNCVREQKSKRQIELISLKYQIDEQRKYVSTQIRSITRTLKEGQIKKKTNQRESESKSKTKQKSLQKNSQQKIKSLETSIVELQQVLFVKQKHIQMLQKILDRHCRKSNKIMSMVKQFDEWFSDLGHEHFVRNSGVKGQFIKLRPFHSINELNEFSAQIDSMVQNQSTFIGQPQKQQNRE